LIHADNDTSGDWERQRGSVRSCNISFRRFREERLFATVSLIILAVPLCDVASHTLGGIDDKRIVADEFLGFPVAVIGQSAARQPLVMASVFLVSRILDGIKPPPAAQAENIPGGLGIVLDDFAANLYTWLLLAGATWIYHQWK
jgi:phosphatidylglycerophosphatase A